MTTEQLLDEIRALPPNERERLFHSVRDLFAAEVPPDFLKPSATSAWPLCIDGNGIECGSAGRVNYRFRAVEKFWKNFYRLSASQKDSVREAWAVFKSDPFHPSLGTHEIHALSEKAKHTIYSVVVAADLRVLFRIDGDWVTTLDVGTHKVYQELIPFLRNNWTISDDM